MIPASLPPPSEPSAVDASARRLSRTMLRTVGEHELIADGDRILVAVSGGKDSHTLLDLLMRARRRAPVKYELFAVHVDQGQPGYDGARLEAYLRGLDVPHEIVHEDTYSVVIENTEPGATFCRICSRLRRGILYSVAERLGCNKVALGHHREDVLVTLLLNLFYAGRLQAMPASYVTNDGRFRVIRPLVACAEDDIAAHARLAGYPILPCNLCGSQDDMKRRTVRGLLADLAQRIPDLRSVMLAALGNVRPSHLLDREVAEAWETQASRFPPRR